jgi:hypothetical protein
MMELDAGSRWTMADAAYHLHALYDQDSTTGTHAHASAPAEPTTATLVDVVTEPEPSAAPDPDPAPPLPSLPTEQRRRRWPVALAAAAVALVIVVAIWLLVPDDDEEVTPVNTGDDPSGQASTKGGEPADPDPTDDGGSEEPPPSSSSPDSDAPAPAADDPEQFVIDYYGLLPGDTAAAWPLLSPDMQAEVGSFEDYEAFWSTIDAVAVDDTTPAGSNAVDVTLTYTTEGSSEQETRRIELEETDDGFVIVAD